MVVFFKLNSADFSPLFSPTFLKSSSSIFLSLPYAYASNSLSDTVSLSSKHLPNSANKFLPMLFDVSRGTFVPNPTHISSKLFMSDFTFNVSKKYNHHLVCNSVMNLYL